MAGFKYILWLLPYLLISCIDNKNLDQTLSSNQYFSTKDYFESEALRLSKINQPVLKSVKRNDGIEEKKITIDNWKKEFNLFIESDINKASWKDSYDIIKNKDTIIYKSNDPELKTRQIQIVKNNNGKITFVFLRNLIRNELYNSEEKLSYYPDSLYHIKKVQEVIMLGTNHYEVSYRFQ